MRIIGIALALMLAAAAASAQQPAGDQPAQADKIFTSSADITALIAKAKGERPCSTAHERRRFWREAA